MQTRKQIQTIIVVIVVLVALFALGQSQKAAQKPMCLDQGQPIACSMLNN